jgi:hypothetical protein
MQDDVPQLAPDLEASDARRVCPMEEGQRAHCKWLSQERTVQFNTLPRCHQEGQISSEPHRSV